MAVTGPVLAIRGPILRKDLPGLYARACLALGAAEGSRLRVDVAGVAADAVTVDALARVELAARRHGCRLVLEGADRDMRDLIALMGLEEVFLSPRAAEARTGETAARYRGRT
jgi:ABC-type transporter Mla MlaB component